VDENIATIAASGNEPVLFGGAVDDDPTRMRGLKFIGATFGSGRIRSCTVFQERIQFVVVGHDTILGV
jgi:hypothetical protein